MVRLFVPEGEGQHALARRRPGALPAQPDVLASPLRSCMAAAGITGFLALVGRSRPGIFLQSAAIFGVFDLSYTTCDIYGRRELNRGIFKLDGIEAKPGKLWERTKHWTVEDAALSGGGLGLFTALNPRALPGASGWKRMLGSAMVGAAFGSLVGERLLVRIPPQLLTLIDTADIMTRRTQYERLQQDAEAKASLSRFGKIALSIYTWPALQLLRGPTGVEVAHGHGMTSAKGVSHPGPNGPQTTIAQQLQNTITFHVEFDKEELSGPDIEEGSRAYKDSLGNRDTQAIESYLEHLHSLKQSMVLEARYIWHLLAQKERMFYSLVDSDSDDDEQDLYRREIQLLNSVATQFISREAILAFHIADARKQLSQIQNGQHDTSASTLATAVPASLELSSDTLQTPASTAIETPSETYNPHLTTAQLRTVWTRQKEILAQIENVVSQYDAVDAHNSGGAGAGNASVIGGGNGNSQIEQLRLNKGYLEKNVEATGRLLREFEEQVRRAEESEGGSGMGRERGEK